MSDSPDLLANSGTITPGARMRGLGRAIGRLVSALDDRNIIAAIEVLEADGGAPEGGRSTRVRCVGCGE